MTESHPSAVHSDRMLWASIEISMITTSELDISLLVHESDVDNALQALNKAFEL